jgi:hypothetical protein
VEGARRVFSAETNSGRKPIGPFFCSEDVCKDRSTSNLKYVVSMDWQRNGPTTLPLHNRQRCLGFSWNRQGSSGVDATGVDQLAIA